MARGRVGIGVRHNIENVVSDIEDVKDDLDHEMRKRVGAAMRVLWADAKQYVLNDPHTTGDLFSAIRQEVDTTQEGLEFSVYTDASIAPYAAIVEFGSGTRSNIGWGPGNNVPDSWPGLGSAVPLGYPFEAPDIQNLGGFAYFIEQWMRTKGVTPKYDSFRASALAIAKTIDDRGNYAHPYMRPAWFDNELQIRRAARNAVKNAAR